MGVATDVATELKLVVKNTFFEYVCEDMAWLLDCKPSRQRSRTEPTIQLGTMIDELGKTGKAFPAVTQQACHAAWQASPQLQQAIPETHMPVVSVSYPGWSQQWSDQYSADWWSYSPNWNTQCQERNDQSVNWNNHEQYQSDSGDGSTQRLPTIAEASSCTVLADAENEANETRTTVMLRGLPENVTRSGLLDTLHTRGFFGRYNFVYVPIDFKRNQTLGYALVNLVSPSEALRLMRHFEGFRSWNVPSDAVCSVTWCSPQQGLQAYIERYRNSPVMHESVPEEWQPLLLSHGVPIAFPPPTIKLKAPRLKRSH